MVSKSKCLSGKTIKPPAISNNSLNPKVYYFNNPKFWLKFYGSSLTTDRVFTPNKITNLCIAFEIVFYTYDNFTIKTSLLGAVKLTEDPDPNKLFILDMVLHFKYIELSHCWVVGLINKNVIIFGAVISSSEHVVN